jgi:transposase
MRKRQTFPSAMGIVTKGIDVRQKLRAELQDYLSCSTSARRSESPSVSHMRTWHPDGARPVGLQPSAVERLDGDRRDLVVVKDRAYRIVIPSDLTHEVGGSDHIKAPGFYGAGQWSEDQWKRLKGLLPGKDSDPGRSAYDNRLFLEAILWKVRVGAPWRDLPDEFGPWNSVFKRFRRWAQNGVFEQICNALSGQPDFEYAMIDDRIIRVHQHGMGAQKGGLAIRPPGARALD